MMIPIEIRFFTTPAGSSPVERYLDGLPDGERARVLNVIDEVRENGLGSPMVSARQIDGKLWELRISRHRLFYVIADGPTLVLLHAYKKEGRKAPRAEIDLAKTRMREVLDG